MKWQAEVVEFLVSISRREENAWSDPRRKRCPFCGTKDRHDDDGSWDHDWECVAYIAHHLFMTAPEEAIDAAQNR